MHSDHLPLARASVDRDGHARVRPGLLDDLLAEPSTRVLTIDGDRVATAGSDDAALAFVPPSDRVPGAGLLYLGRDEDAAYLAQVLGAGPRPAAGDLDRRTDDPQGSTVSPPPSYAVLRDIGWQLGDRDAGLAVGALALANWHRTHTHCPRCGTPTEVIDGGWVRRCPADESLHYPRTDAAVIMAISDEAGRILLGHAPQWPEGQFSVPAGFVEPGESLEAAVRREVFEETNVVVGEVTYRASQPWPFPASLMVGFAGRATGTDVRPDGEEITEARFYSADELREAWTTGAIRLPRPTSIARSLIEEWYGEPLPEARAGRRWA
ncbi:NAD(+) diphosphatase [Occultella glacieicola]|uniref:NAD(+) diphosphatase n=1 Tax=Occultella glacieicola TaxID=2518684 RepID=A0ABY2E7G4_9MICO|nr:NAD(+) diphosphatase [Occultella glacieicola]TDE97506.1 NAD(+) diphosphatase [Occultella glacieicola]